MKIKTDFWEKKTKKFYVEFIGKIVQSTLIITIINLIYTISKKQWIITFINTAAVLILAVIQISKMLYDKEHIMDKLKEYEE